MAVREHDVSYRNGPQVMVAGLALRDMGYCRGVQVQVTDPAGSSSHPAWQFVVSNDEHATLVSRNPPPPAWIQPGVRIRIEVRASAEVESQPVPHKSATPNLLSAHDLAEWRRSLIGILNQIEGTTHTGPTEGLADRISRLTRAGRIPREVAAFMRTVTEMRNQTEYREKILDSAESEAVAAAWRAVTEWSKRRDRAR